MNFRSRRYSSKKRLEGEFRLPMVGVVVVGVCCSGWRCLLESHRYQLMGTWESLEVDYPCLYPCLCLCCDHLLSELERVDSGEIEIEIEARRKKKRGKLGRS